MNKRDKLPRLNYLTMLDAMLQYRVAGNRSMECRLLGHVDDIWDNLSDEDQAWLEEHCVVFSEEWKLHAREGLRKNIEEVYNES